ncbi:hypothetical protein I4U23_019763 [Adineta vaga]|nr:hypothetical protein I4U23_019763 [Adineta vaga]
MRPRKVTVTLSSIISNFSKSTWIATVSLFLILIIVLYDLHSYPFKEMTRLLNNSSYSNSINSLFSQAESHTTSTTTSTTSASELVIDVYDRTPPYRVATKNGETPYPEGYRVQAKLLDELRLYEICQRDPSTIVVDVGAYLGDFGMYAAACGCTVYMFEIQSDMISLIRSSIQHNAFSDSRIFVYHNAVSDEPNGTTVTYVPEGSATKISDGISSVQTIRLDDIVWTSSSIYILKVDVEGFELNVLRSAKSLFAKRRIRHLIFKYTPWWTDRAPQQTLLPFVKRELRAKFIYTLNPTENVIYGPLSPKDVNNLYDQYMKSRLQTYIYATFDPKSVRTSIKSQQFVEHN